MEPARSAGATAAWLTAQVPADMPEDIARRWAALLVAGRVVATAMAVVLLAVGGISERDAVLALLGALTALVSTALVLRVHALRRLPAWWVADAGVALALVLASGDWRSPFYLLWLTALAVPAVRLSPRGAGVLGGVAALAFVAVAFVGGPEPGSLDAASSETFAIHVAIPVLMVTGLAYAADVLRRLDRERERSAGLALAAERQRIAWELHDSAKQRVHAAHLLLTSLRGASAPDPRIEQAVVELESAGAEMDTTLAGLRSPLAGRPLHEALARRATELSVAGGPRVEVRGTAGTLPEPLATHAYRIGVEALTNAVRHARATSVRAELARDDGRLVLDIVDDGTGMRVNGRRAGTGLQAMHSRAATVGGTLRVEPGPGGRGTHVRLEIPHHEGAGA